MGECGDGLKIATRPYRGRWWVAWECDEMANQQSDRTETDVIPHDVLTMTCVDGWYRAWHCRRSWSRLVTGDGRFVWDCGEGRRSQYTDQCPLALAARIYGEAWRIGAWSTLWWKSPPPYDWEMVQRPSQSPIQEESGAEILKLHRKIATLICDIGRQPTPDGRNAQPPYRERWGIGGGGGVGRIESADADANGGWSRVVRLLEDRCS